MNAVYYAYYTGVETDGVYFQFTPGVTAGLIPTNDGEACVYAGWPVGESGPFHSDAEEAFAGRVRSAHPRLASALMGATRVSKFRGTPGLPSFLKQPGGPGWALVGDAGYTKDPVSAHGMSDALRDAELCAWAVETALARPNEAALAMAMYRDTRDRLSRSLLDATNRLASYDWSSAEASTLMRQVSTSVHEECRALSTLDTQIGGLVSTG